MNQTTGHMSPTRLALIVFTFLALAAVGVLISRWDRDAPAPIDEPIGQSSKSPGVPLMREVTEQVGLDFVHQVENPDRYFFPAILGSGAALLDIDGDGDLDLYLANTAPIDERRQLVESAAGTTNRLLRQEPDGRFVDITAGSGLDDRAYSMGIAVGDVNNDGFPDVYVSNYGPDRMYLNNGDGTFRDITGPAGINNRGWGCSACFFDYDRDGWLDLFVTNYVRYDPSKRCRYLRGREEFCAPQAFEPTTDRFFHNETGKMVAGNDRRVPVRFSDVTISSGIADQRGTGLGVVCADFNDDRWPDVYVANDQMANFLWINQHDGTFRDEAVLRGCAVDMQGRPQGSMGIAVGDADGDAKLDLFVTHFEGENNALYRSLGGEGFTERCVQAGLALPSLALTGFGTAFVDLDHDGRLDLLLANGRTQRRSSGKAQSFWDDYAEPNQIFLATGNGQFTEFSGSSDPFVSTIEVSRALAVGDIDNDGDVDAVITNTAGRARIYFNDFSGAGHWLQVRVVEPDLGGRNAHGAVVTLVAGSRRFVQLANPGFSYLASNDPRVHFGLGSLTTIDRIEVVWPDGSEELFSGGPVDRLRMLEHGRGTVP
ncbi:MAG: CRTAC1 family protein [Planctomycetaceae bacterium]